MAADHVWVDLPLTPARADWNALDDEGRRGLVRDLFSALVAAHDGLDAADMAGEDVEHWRALAVEQLRSGVEVWTWVATERLRGAHDLRGPVAALRWRIEQV